jgi:hypothetical protein
MPDETILLHADVLIDRKALSAALSEAWADVLAVQIGGKQEVWQRAYQRVAEDWESYWADLDLSSEDSVSQWREGRWRVTRAWFRLAGQPIPDAAQSNHYLDTLTETVGVKCSAWKSGAAEAINALTQAAYRVAILDPYLPSPLLRGMLTTCCSNGGRQVLGPDELGQVGIEGIEWGWLATLIDTDPARTRFVSPHPMNGTSAIAPPTDLSQLVSLIKQKTGISA